MEVKKISILGGTGDLGTGLASRFIKAKYEVIIGSRTLEKAKEAGAQFWIVKSDEIEPRLEEFRDDYEGYKSRDASFKVYR